MTVHKAVAGSTVVNDPSAAPVTLTMLQNLSRDRSAKSEPERRMFAVQAARE